MRQITIKESDLRKEIRNLVSAHVKEYNVIKPCVLTYERFIEIQSELILAKYKS